MFPRELYALEHISVVISVPRKIIARADGHGVSPCKTSLVCVPVSKRYVYVRTIIDSERWVDKVSHRVFYEARFLRQSV